jgi:uncharacterized protein (TIGR03067 family)
MIRRLLLSAALLSLAFAPAPLPKKSRNKRDTNESDLARMQGKWVRVKLGISGHPNVDNCPITITGTRMQFPSPDDAWILTLDAGRSPKSIDAARVTDRNSLFRGIYRFEGGDLIICWRGPDQKPERPQKLEAGAQGVWYQVYKRQ